jgi:DNA polymerase I-like protein with 3'-5' exonuclease and polymerase domains
MAGLFEFTPKADKAKDKVLLANIQGGKKTNSPAITVKGVKNIAQKIASLKDSVERYLGDKKDKYVLITDRNIRYAEEVIAESIKNGYVAIDTETTSLNPITCDIVGMSLFTKGMKAVYIPLNHKSYITGVKAEHQVTKDYAKQLIEKLVEANVKFIFFNAKFDIRVIKNQLGVAITPYFDAYIASRLLNENEPEKGLKALHKKYVLNGEEDAFSFGELFKDVPFDLVPISTGYLYAARDAEVTFELYEFQLPYLTLGTAENEEQELQGVSNVFWNIEMPIVNAVADMEDLGVGFDFDVQKRLSEKYHKLQDEAEEAFYTALKEYTNNEYSISSPTQLAALFYDELRIRPVNKKKPRSTDSETLKQLNHPLSELILNYREYAKLISTYIDKMAECALADGRVHGEFNQVGTDTGRFSSNNPNLQNIPSKNAEIRTMFKATDGYMMISSDFSAQEPKLLASMSHDERMIYEFNNGIDPYVTLATIAFDLPYEDCCEFYPDGTTNKEGKKRRKRAKILLLGISYGMGIEAIAEKLEVSVEKAHKIMDGVFNVYKSFKPFTEQSERMAREKGYVTSYWGRKRRLPDINLPEYEFEYSKFSKDYGKEVPYDIQNYYYKRLKNTRGFKKPIFEEANRDGIYVIDNTSKIALAERQCINARVQSSAADQTKIAMRLICENKRLKELGFRLLIQVHDELIGECPEENVEECSEIFKKCMTASANDLPIETKTDVTMMRNWDN